MSGRSIHKEEGCKLQIAPSWFVLVTVCACVITHHCVKIEYDNLLFKLFNVFVMEHIKLQRLHVTILQYPSVF